MKLSITYNPTTTAKCDSSLITSYQDVVLGERDQSLGLRGHSTLTHYTSSGGMSKYVYIRPLPRTVNEVKERVSETMV